ncbi:MarR family winged helix-turn-helix transcriptional regulator [Timonella sp. A28]|uniref:MarR family winged helix-turn-helix transcriptional regulator n=1 Tax=Timonella sp. A28 TaxID=3442640 RepID=UPI003EBA10B1
MTENVDFDRWLSAQQQRNWRAYLEGQAILWNGLNADLETFCDLSISEYEILVRLSERENYTMRMSVLADEIAQSRSRVSHTVRRLEKRNLVMRKPALNDGRGVDCVMTEHGYSILQRSAPIHVASVRDRLVDVLTEEELSLLAVMFRRVAYAAGRDTSDSENTFEVL